MTKTNNKLKYGHIPIQSEPKKNGRKPAFILAGEVFLAGVLILSLVKIAIT